MVIIVDNTSPFEFPLYGNTIAVVVSACIIYGRVRVINIYFCPLGYFVPVVIILSDIKQY